MEGKVSDFQILYINTDLFINIVVYFFSFQSHFRWDETQPGMDVATIKKLWERQAARRYDELVGKHRAQGQKPKWIESAVWDLWVAAWNTPEFRAKSERQRANRRVNPALHTSGSRSHRETRVLMVCKSKFLV